MLATATNPTKDHWECSPVAVACDLNSAEAWQRLVSVESVLDSQAALPSENPGVEPPEQGGESCLPSSAIFRLTSSSCCGWRGPWRLPPGPPHSSCPQKHFGLQQRSTPFPAESPQSHSTLILAEAKPLAGGSHSPLTLLPRQGRTHKNERIER